MKKGFTLVELSIVLVIIGLLIGGILVAQSMISSSKIISMVKRLEQYNVAVNNFQLNFKQIPGDSNLFIPAGNNDGSNTNGTGNCNGAYYSGNEFTQVYSHLYQSGMLSEQYPQYSPSDCGGPHAAYSTYPYLAGMAGIIYPIFAKSALYQNTMTLGPYTLNPDQNIPLLYWVTPGAPREFYTYADQYDAVALETKLDDGHGASGSGMRTYWYYDGTTPCENYTPALGHKAFCALYWYPDNDKQ